MKNWNYIEGAKVGNIKDDKKAQQLWDEMQHAKKLAEDWAREIHRTGKEEYKGSQKDAEEAYRKAKREYEKYAMNAKTGNEKTDVEGFFKQLSDDVKEREEKDDEDIEKVGNVASEYEILKQDPSKMHPLYKKAYEEAMKKLAREDEDFKKRFEKEYGVKAKNEASDDKFAYVMREFDEGKLKTPDGKVVTDQHRQRQLHTAKARKPKTALREQETQSKNLKFRSKQKWQIQKINYQLQLMSMCRSQKRK